MSSYTPSLGLELITPGSQAGLWGNTTNNSLNLIDQAITGVTPISFAAASGTTYTLTDFNGAQDESRAAVLNITGSAIGANTVVIPNKQKTYLVRNNTGQDVTFQTPTPGASYAVGAGYSILIFCDGNNNVFTGIASPGVGTLSVNAGGTGATTFTAGFIKSTGGTNALTSSSTVALGSEVSGTLPVANGGTGKTSLASGALLFGNGSGSVGEFVGGSVGQVATWNGSAWTAVTPAAGAVTSVNSKTGDVVLTASDVGALSTSGTAANSSQLGGVAAASYLTTTAGNAAYLSKTTANNSVPDLYFGGTIANAPIAIGSSGIRAGNINSYINGSSTTLTLYPGGTGFIHNSNGNASAPGTWQSLSDVRLKENITPLVNSLSLVSQLNPVKFSMKKDHLSQPNRYGLLAQELEQVVPEAVETTDSDFDGVENVKAVAYTELVPILIKAIQELKSEIDALKAAK